MLVPALPLASKPIQNALNQLESNPLLIEIQFGAIEMELETQSKLATFKLRLNSMEND